MSAVKWSVPALAVMLAACGGDSSSDVFTPSKKSETGVFTDSAVAGIFYRTESRSGYTNALGEYRYQEGETVTFSIGGTELPPVPATGRITPADMAVAGQPDTVTNILRLLQTLDEDGNPDNGISIPASAHAGFTGVELDVTGAAATFEAEAELQIGAPLVSAAQAEAHFEASQQADLRGSWIFVEPAGESSNGLGPNGEEVNVLTFLDGGRYIVVHKYGNDDQGAATAEWGTYSWDTASGAIAINMVGQSDSNGGLNHMPAGDTIHLVGNELHLGSEAGAATPFQRVADDRNPNVGGWLLDGADFVVLTILDNDEYVIAHSNNTEAYTGDSLVAVTSEWGRYSLSGGTFEVTAVESETDGNGGFYDAEASGSEGLVASFENTRYGDLVFEPVGGEPFALRRIGRFAVELSDLVDNKSTVVVERVGGVFTAGQAKLFEFDLVGEGTVAHVDLGAGGSGDVTFAPGTLDQEVGTIVGSWSAYPGTGRLAFRETMGPGGTGSWVFAPIRTSDGSEKALVDFKHIEGPTINDVGFFISELRDVSPPAP